MKKTNAMRILDTNKVAYEVRTYDTSDGKLDGVSVAYKTGLDPNLVFKTLVSKGQNTHFVFIIPVYETLNLKKAAIAAGEKKIEMIQQKDLKTITGYVHGGCSPIGMKKHFPTFIDQSARDLENMAVSAGRVGFQVILNPKDVVHLVLAQWADHATS